MRYLHTMIRVKDLEANLDFFCHKLGLVEFSRKESQSGRFTLIFLCAKEDVESAELKKSPLIELTYNWPDENGNVEEYQFGRGFGHLAFRVENIYELCRELELKGVPILRPPRDGHMAFIKSPEGVSIELLQAGEPLAPQEPWVSKQNQGSW